MPKTILMEELHVTVAAPAGLREVDYRAILRTLRSKSFRTRSLDAFRKVFRRHPSLKKTRFGIDR